MKIKTFTFKISNFAGSADLGTDFRSLKSDYESPKESLSTSEKIDKTINEFISGVDVVSISVNHPVIYRHNNACYDTVQAIYTIVYNEKS